MPPTNFISPTGRVVAVEPGDEQMYRSLGYSPESLGEQSERVAEAARREYYSEPLQQVQAGVEGLVSGATLGISDMIAGPDSEMAQRARANPGIRLGTEILGGIAGLKLPLGAGVSKLGKGVGGALGAEAGGLRGVLAKGAGTAVEGAIQGAGVAGAQARLNGDPLSVETFTSGATLGGLMGFGASTLGAGLERMGAKAQSKIAAEASATQKVADEIAHHEAVIKRADEVLAGSPTSPIHGPAWSEFRHQARSVADEMATARVGVDEAVAALKAEGASFRRSVQPSLDNMVSEEAAHIKGIQGTQKHFEDLAGGALPANAPASWHTPNTRAASAAAGLAADLGAQGKSKWAVPAVGQAADEADKALSRAYKTLDTTEARAAASKLFKVAERAGVRFGEGAGSMGQLGFEAAMNALDQARDFKNVGDVLRSLPSDLSNITRAQADKIAAAISKAPALHSGATHLPEAADALLDKLGVVHDGSVSERLFAGFESARVAKRAVPGQAAQMKAAKAAARVEKKAASEALKGLHEDLESKAHKGKIGIMARLGRYVGGHYAAKGASGAERFVRFAAGSAAVGALLGQDTTTSALAGLVMGARGRGSNLVRNAVAKWAGTFGKGLRASSPALVQIMRHTMLDTEDSDTSDLRELVKRRAQEIAQLMPQVEDQAYASSAFVEGHPEFQVAVQDQLITKIKYLHEMAPKNPGTVIVAGVDRWGPSELRARDYAERWFGAEYPAEAAVAFLAGRASAATIHALAAVNPAYYELVRSTMQNWLSDPGVMRRMDKAARAQASWFTGVPYDSSQTEDAVAFFQNQLINGPTNNPPPPEPPQAQNGGRPSPVELSDAQSRTYR